MSKKLKYMASRTGEIASRLAKDKDRTIKAMVMQVQSTQLLLGKRRALWVNRLAQFYGEFGYLSPKQIEILTSIFLESVYLESKSLGIERPPIKKGKPSLRLVN